MRLMRVLLTNNVYEGRKVLMAPICGARLDALAMCSVDEAPHAVGLLAGGLYAESGLVVAAVAVSRHVDIRERHRCGRVCRRGRVRVRRAIARAVRRIGVERLVIWPPRRRDPHRR